MILREETWIDTAPAKLNLFFEVRDKRDDGYHNVFSVCCPISLYDTLFFLPRAEEGIDFSCTQNHIPSDETNLVVRAVELVKQTCRVTRGAKIRLIKRIPTQAGLGGGSSDAATAIMLANCAWKLGLSRKVMMEIGAKIGSDVPLFFAGGTSLGEGRGEVIKRITTPRKLDFVVLKPPEGIATNKAFASLEKKGSFKTPWNLIHGLETGNQRLIREEMFNRLESVAEKLYPKICEIRNAFAKMDCLGFQMTGSGTAYFGLCRNSHHAKHITARIRNLGWGTAFHVESIQQQSSKEY